MNNTRNDDYFGSLDGWNPDASKRVLIEDCFGWAGDDNVAVKSGRKVDGRERLSKILGLYQHWVTD